MAWVADKSRRRAYYDKTSRDKPSNLLVEALKYVQAKGTALDLGCGAGVESRALAEKGFKTTAVDVNPEVKGYFESSQVTVVIQPFEAFDFEHYDFIFAKNSLVFLSPKLFAKVVKKIKEALNPGGVLAARLWGPKDSEKATKANTYTFLSTGALKRLFAGYEILNLTETETDSLNVYGQQKHWHLIDFIVRKPET